MKRIFFIVVIFYSTMTMACETPKNCIIEYAIDSLQEGVSYEEESYSKYHSRLFALYPELIQSSLKPPEDKSYLNAMKALLYTVSGDSVSARQNLPSDPSNKYYHWYLYHLAKYYYSNKEINKADETLLILKDFNSELFNQGALYKLKYLSAEGMANEALALALSIIETKPNKADSRLIETAYVVAEAISKNSKSIPQQIFTSEITTRTEAYSIEQELETYLTLIAAGCAGGNVTPFVYNMSLSYLLVDGLLRAASCRADNSDDIIKKTLVIIDSNPDIYELSSMSPIYINFLELYEESNI